MRGLVILALLAATAFAATACDGDDDESDVMATATAPAATATSPAATATTDTQPSPGSPTSTGIDSVDAIAAAVRSGDAARLGDLVLFRQVACTTNIQDIGGPPECREGEAEGTEVLVIFGASCEGYYAREDELHFERVALGTPPLYGVFRITPDVQLAQAWSDATYAIVLNRTGATDATLAFTVYADDQGIVGFSEGCGETPAQYADAHGLTEAIIAPAE